MSEAEDPPFMRDSRSLPREAVQAGDWKGRWVEGEVEEGKGEGREGRAPQFREEARDSRVSSSGESRFSDEGSLAMGLY